MEGMSTSLNDMMTMIPITRAHGLEEQQLQSVEEKISSVYDIGQMFDRITAIFGATAWVVMGVMQTLFLAGSVYACFGGVISVGDVVMFNSFFLVLSGQLTGVLNILPQCSQARESLTFNNGSTRMPPILKITAANLLTIRSAADLNSAM